MVRHTDASKRRSPLSPVVRDDRRDTARQEVEAHDGHGIVDPLLHSALGEAADASRAHYQPPYLESVRC